MEQDKELGIKTPIYASDLDISKRKDSFMGIGFEEAMKKAQEEDADLVVGYFDDNWKTK